MINLSFNTVEELNTYLKTAYKELLVAENELREAELRLQREQEEAEKEKREKEEEEAREAALKTRKEEILELLKPIKEYNWAPVELIAKIKLTPSPSVNFDDNEYKETDYEVIEVVGGSDNLNDEAKEWLHDRLYEADFCSELWELVVPSSVVESLDKIDNVINSTKTWEDECHLKEFAANNL